MLYMSEHGFSKKLNDMLVAASIRSPPVEEDNHEEHDFKELLRTNQTSKYKDYIGKPWFAKYAKQIIASLVSHGSTEDHCIYAAISEHDKDHDNADLALSMDDFRFATAQFIPLYKQLIDVGFSFEEYENIRRILKPNASNEEIASMFRAFRH